MQNEDREATLTKYRPFEDTKKAREYLGLLCSNDPNKRPHLSIPPRADDWDMVFRRIIKRCEDLDND